MQDTLTNVLKEEIEEFYSNDKEDLRAMDFTCAVGGLTPSSEFNFIPETDVIESTPRLPCEDQADTLPLISMIGHNEDPCEKQLMSDIDNLQQTLSPNVPVDCNQEKIEDMVDLSVIENAPLIGDFEVGETSNGPNALSAESNSFQETLDGIFEAFGEKCTNSPTDVMTCDTWVTQRSSDPLKTFPHPIKNSIKRSSGVEEFQELRDSRKNDRDQEVIIPVNILHLLQDEEEDVSLAATDNKSDDILEFLTSETSENPRVGTECPNPSQISLVNIIPL